MGNQEGHSEVTSNGQRPTIVILGRLDFGRLGAPGNLAEEAEGARLVTPAPNLASGVHSYR
jgi:hypothetical protein